MSAIGNVVSSIGSAVGSVFGGGGGGILKDVINGAAGFVTGGPVGAVLALAGSALNGSASAGSMGGNVISGIESLIGGGSSGLGGFLSDIGSGIETIFKGGFSTFMQGAGSILSDIKSGIDQVSKLENQVISPIGDVVNGITKDVQAINDEIVGPIRNLIDNYNRQSTSVLTSISSDLHSGIQGVLKLPQDLANAFTSVDAQFARATQQLGQINQQTVSDTLIPGMSDVIGGPLNGLITTLTSPEYTGVNSAAFLEGLPLPETVGADPAFQKIQEIIKAFSEHGGFFGPLFQGVADGFRLADYLLNLGKISLQPVFQQALADLKPTLLSVGEALEANRRRIISPDAFKAEALKHGINEERQAILYELAQFLFGAREAVELRQRGIISDADYQVLIDQNNLSTDQAQALTELMQHPLSPADVAAGVARGYISEADAEPMYQAALVPENVRPLIPELEQDLVNPRLMMRMRGRKIAAENGFIRESLLSDPPEDIVNQYDRTQAEDGTAQLDWLEHWDVPAARWWVVAYFRGLRTRTELENAFQAARIPPELWDDIIEVEREIPPVWLVPDIVKTGVWSAEQAIPTLMKLGFTQENAQVLYDYGASKASTAAATTADSLAKVSLGNAKAAFDDGLIDAATYRQILIDHKYTTAAADLTVQLAQYNQAQTALKNQATLLVEEVKLGMIGKATAEADLYNLGMTTAQVAKYLDEIDRAKVINAKLPSETQLKDMWKKGVIDQATALNGMELLGYSSVWAERIIQTW